MTTNSENRRGDDPARPMMTGVATTIMLIACFGMVVVAATRWREIGWGGAVWLAGFVAMTAIRLPHARRAKAMAISTARQGLDEKLLLFGMFATMMVLPLLQLVTGALTFADYFLPDAATAIGAGIELAMLWLFYRSHADLGRNWSPGLEIRVDHRLVSDGVYRRLRHPMYVSIWLAAIAQPLLIHNWLAGALVLPAFAAMWFFRVPQEEAMMRERFGAAYEDYCARTGLLWPGRG